MALPIEPTPPLEGADADALLASLEGGASDDEMRRRTEEARRSLALIDAPGGKRIWLLAIRGVDSITLTVNVNELTNGPKP